MNLRILRLPAAALMAVLCLACTPGGGSIYFTLENEVKVEDASLPNKITVFDVANTGTAYYAAAGKIWTAPVAAANFQVADVVTPPHAGDLCTALAFFSGELYGGFVNPSGNLGLHATTALSFTPASPIVDPDVSGAQVALLKVEDDGTPRLIALTVRPSGAAGEFEYAIAYSTDGSAYSVFPFDLTRAAGEELKPIHDVIWSADQAAWFATEGTKLYTDRGTGTMTLASMTGITAGEELIGLYDDGGNVYVASKAGAIYYADNGAALGASWTRIAAPTISGAHPPLTRFAGPVGTGILLVGSDGYGYYRLDTTNLAAGTAAVTRFPTTTTPLYTALVRFIVVDGTRAFAGTAMDGLWRGTIAVDGTIAWSLE